MAVPHQRPGVASAIRAWLGFALLIIAQFGIRPFFPARGSADFALVAVLFCAVRVRPGTAAVIGCLTGLALGALAPDTFGAQALIFTCIGASASALKAAFFSDNLGLTALFVLGGKWLSDVLLLLLVGAPGGGSVLLALIWWFPLAAVTTALTAIFALVVLRPLYRPPGR